MKASTPTSSVRACCAPQAFKSNKSKRNPIPRRVERDRREVRAGDPRAALWAPCRDSMGEKGHSSASDRGSVLVGWSLPTPAAGAEIDGQKSFKRLKNNSVTGIRAQSGISPIPPAYGVGKRLRDVGVSPQLAFERRRRPAP